MNLTNVVYRMLRAVSGLPQYMKQSLKAWLWMVGSVFGAVHMTSREWMCANEANSHLFLMLPHQGGRSICIKTYSLMYPDISTSNSTINTIIITLSSMTLTLALPPSTQLPHQYHQYSTPPPSSTQIMPLTKPLTVLQCT